MVDSFTHCAQVVLIRSMDSGLMGEVIEGVIRKKKRKEKENEMQKKEEFNMLGMFLFLLLMGISFG